MNITFGIYEISGQREGTPLAGGTDLINGLSVFLQNLHEGCTGPVEDSSTTAYTLKNGRRKPWKIRLPLLILHKEFIQGWK
jgi:hypothetical protein